MNKKTILFAVCCILVLAGCAFAVPTIGVDTFTGNPPTDWSSEGQVTSLNNPQIPNLTFTIDSGIGDQAGLGHVYTTDPDFIGNYTLYVGPSATIKFDFIGADQAQQISLYFHSPTLNQTWYFAESLTDGSHTIGLGTYSLGWFSFQSDLEADFYTSIESIDRIGLFVQNAELGSYEYSMDNFEIGVPEPETVWMIIAVALSLGMTFRGRLAELAGQVKGRFVKA